jgi:hypothetical protein
MQSIVRKTNIMTEPNGEKNTAAAPSEKGTVDSHQYQYYTYE